jgi:hypothetical protein
VIRNRTGWKALALLALIAAACSSQPASPTIPPSASSSRVATAQPATPSRSAKPSPTEPANLSPDQRDALNSLTQVDDYPLYTMSYHHSYSVLADPDPVAMARWEDLWGCSLFAALGDPKNMLFGRNFDWEYSPALMLFYTPDDGYASVSMLNIEFLGYNDRTEKGLATASLAEREALLNAPAYAFDGMNSKGLVAGFAMVPNGTNSDDPGKLRVASLYVIRELLDHAASVDEAVKIVQSYNVWNGAGRSIEWLVADTSGQSALLDVSSGKLVVKPSEHPWHMATNFVAPAGASDESWKWRYAILTRDLEAVGGSLTPQGGMDLLSSVAQGTQWSAVYQMKTGDVQVAMGGRYERVHTFHLDMQP